MSGYGINPPPGRLTGQQGFQPATVAHTVVTVQMPCNQRVLYVLPGYQVVNLMPPAPLPTGYPPNIALHSHTVSPAPARPHYYQQPSPQWQRPAPASTPYIPERRTNEVSLDEAYRNLRECHHEQLANLGDWEWHELARILKPGMEACGYPLGDEHTVANELKSLSRDRNIRTFEALEAAVLERAFSRETAASQPLETERILTDGMADPIAESPETAGSFRESAVQEHQPETTQHSPMADGNLSETDNRNTNSSRVAEQLPETDSREPEAKSDAIPGWWQRHSPGALVKRLQQWWRGNVDAGNSDSRHHVLSTKESKPVSDDTLTVEMQYQNLKALSNSVVTCWNFFDMIYEDYINCIKQLRKLPNDRKLDASEKSDIMEYIKQQMDELGPQLNEAASDVIKTLKIYKTTEKQVLDALNKHADDSFDVRGIQSDLPVIQSKVREVEKSLEKVQTDHKKK